MRTLPILLFMMLSTACSAASTSPVMLNGEDVQFTDGPSMSAPRATHALVRVADGYLLAIGGCVQNGCEPGPASATVDIISPDASRIVSRGDLLARRVQPGAVALPDGTALVIGGWVNGAVTSTTEIFDPVKKRSIQGPTMAVPRASATIVPLADGRVLIAGGYDGHRVRAESEIYDPKTRRLVAAGPLSIARSGASGTLLTSGRVLLVGGGDGESSGRRALASAELFDPRTGIFAPTGGLTQRRYKHGAVGLPSGDVLIIGGSDERDYDGKLRSVERYDAASGTFQPAGELATARFKLADGVLLLSPKTVLVAAGDEHPELFDIQTGRGSLLPVNLGGQWNYMTVVPAGKQRAFLAGGYREGRIEPTARSWVISFDASPGNGL